MNDDTHLQIGHSLPVDTPSCSFSGWGATPIAFDPSSRLYGPSDGFLAFHVIGPLLSDLGKCACVPCFCTHKHVLKWTRNENTLTSTMSMAPYSPDSGLQPN